MGHRRYLPDRVTKTLVLTPLPEASAHIEPIRYRWSIAFMVSRANWKGFEAVLVTCPIALGFPRPRNEKISFNQINKKTGHRIRYLRSTPRLAGSSNEEIIKGYQVDMTVISRSRRTAREHRA